jgi:hypothetical protein
VFLRDVGHGLLEVSHNSLALLGLLIVGIALFATGRADLREALEAEAFSWLQARQEARSPPAVPEPELGEPDAVARATASDPRELSSTQAAVAVWLARRYRVAPEPVRLDPTLILAVMAVESNFNPFAQSPVGAQGLMQVMTKVHDDKYEAFGGSHAAFDPVTNLRVGVQVLKECIGRAGSLEAGLRFYVGAANGDDSGYAAKVLTEQNILRQLAGMKPLAMPAPRASATVTQAPDADVTPGTAGFGADARPPAEPALALPDRIALLR